MSEAVVVRERPIIFSSEMVCAILDGRKTQTRRVVKVQPTVAVAQYTLLGDYWKPVLTLYGWDGVDWSPSHQAALALIDAEPNESIRCPYGQPGDRLWVRETLRGDGQPGNRRVGITRYAADGEMVLPCTTCGNVICATPDCGGTVMDHVWEWDRPILSPIHMPRWASRLTLEITEVRVQRVQEVGAEDCEAEGIRLPVAPSVKHPGLGTPLLCLTGPVSCVDFCERHPRDWTLADFWRFEYANLWDALNKKRGYGWDANPHVWAITFRCLGGAAPDSAGKEETP
jgi:hypothetical protein